MKTGPLIAVQSRSFSLLGEVTVAATEHGVCLVAGMDAAAARLALLRRYPEARFIAENPASNEMLRQLEEYAAGGRTEFSVALDPAGTEFQRRVWELTRAIPYGETRTYGTLARELGAPGAARAVGAAMGANPLAILVPCHRVLGAAGRLTGYAYGLSLKQRLLELEGYAPTLLHSKRSAGIMVK